MRKVQILPPVLRATIENPFLLKWVHQNLVRKWFIASTWTANVTLTCYDVIITSIFLVGQFSPDQACRAHYSITSLGFIMNSNSIFNVIMIITQGCLTCILKTNKIYFIFLFRRKSSTLNWDHVPESTQLSNHHLKIHFY